ncbi:MAG: 4Fe-4S binding protein [Planctomycetes bacterium]|nr:4Fe-4S binding protein [Planctomycetota bacterium]
MPSYKTLQWARRISQALFLLFFFWLLVNTFYQGLVGEGELLREALPYPVSLFLQIDPLAALSTLLATGSVYSELLWSLIIIIPTLFLGRWFCGWVCPFGTVNNLFSNGSNLTRKLRVKRNGSGKHQRIKYAVLLFVLGSAVAGTLFVGFLDPLCFLIRSLGLSILPALDRLGRSTIDLLPQNAAPVAESMHRFMDQHFLGADLPRFQGGFFIGVLFLVVVALNRFMPRFWCRVICPLGALLGLLSRFIVFGIHKKEDACAGCTLCTQVCQGAADPGHGVPWKPSECFLCFNCLKICPKESLDYRRTVQSLSTESKVDFSKRGLLGFFALGIAALPLARSGRDPRIDHGPGAVRPPGACDETAFLERCIKCGQCMKVCPNNALHPAAWEAGFEGVWSPVLVPRIGYCEPTCTLCSQVCPTGAIRHFQESDKKENSVKIGTAFFDRGRCLPWAMGKECMVCEEFCPTSPKSIWFEKQEIQGPDGNRVMRNLPHVNPALCTGCGVCEHVCPVADRSAVRVTSVGESRSKENRILITGKVTDTKGDSR